LVRGQFSPVVAQVKHITLLDFYETSPVSAETIVGMQAVYDLVKADDFRLRGWHRPWLGCSHAHVSQGAPDGSIGDPWGLVVFMLAAFEGDPDATVAAYRFGRADTVVDMGLGTPCLTIPHTLGIGFQPPFHEAINA
jgi:hypothetical protein